MEENLTRAEKKKRRKERRRRRQSSSSSSGDDLTSSGNEEEKEKQKLVETFLNSTKNSKRSKTIYKFFEREKIKDDLQDICKFL